jgi:eukaryotic-like serine/threonine-protein kinase
MLNSTISQVTSLIGRTIGDHNRYRIESLIGEGGMGKVYQATDTRLGKLVAIKLLKTSSIFSTTREELDSKRRFERECAVCAVLKSDNIVQVSDYGTTDEGFLFYVMEFLEGLTLKQILAQESKISVERTRQIMLQICAGLTSAHEGTMIKVIHRDLKPANIFIEATKTGERVKILDFGIAKIQSSSTENTTFTNAFLGTHHYAAPEQFDYQKEIDERVDIYCLGIMFYEMLAGVDPFGLKLHDQRVTGESWIKAHLLKSVQPLRSQTGCESLSIELEQIVMRCLEKCPDQRFPSVQALVQALECEQNTSASMSNSRALPKEKSTNGSMLQNPKQHELEEDTLTEALSHSFLSTPVPSLDINLAFLEQCQSELATCIGPMATLIIKQTLGETDDWQPQKFIDALASHIPDINAANHFRQSFTKTQSILPSKGSCFIIPAIFGSISRQLALLNPLKEHLFSPTHLSKPMFLMGLSVVLTIGFMNYRHSDNKSYDRSHIRSSSLQQPSAKKKLLQKKTLRRKKTLPKTLSHEKNI